MQKGGKAHEPQFWKGLELRKHRPGGARRAAGGLTCRSQAFWFAGFHHPVRLDGAQVPRRVADLRKIRRSFAGEGGGRDHLPALRYRHGNPPRGGDRGSGRRRAPLPHQGRRQRRGGRGARPPEQPAGRTGRLHSVPRLFCRLGAEPAGEPHRHRRGRVPAGAGVPARSAGRKQGEKENRCLRG